ncbi:MULTISPECIES: anti-sigma factor domain-containing protein [unclassified Enterobacter]|uniref:anti-sigma factor n=1 Tax=unclassified Enterobacter TaxID=2608935 RepID=UPI001CBFDB36|nr:MULTISPECIES: anti-sigma factor [unclassified Enterobacter]UAN42055.1 anti-sigma factor [Enterobacter sp. JBIWA008]UXP22908.1 anti-sigma factor [Enterobacter sp. 155105]
MNDSEKRDDMLAAEYALGTLRGGARLKFQKRLADEPTLAARAAYWQNMFSTLDSHLAPVPPPETVWKRIVLDLPPKKPLRKSRLYLGWMAAASLAAVTVVTWYSTRTPELAPIMVLNDAQQHGQWIVSADSSRQYLSITPLRPNAIAAQNSLQLWLIPAGKAPISLGLLHSNASTHVAIGNKTLTPDAMIAISLEPEGGSPTGQPTGPVLYSGKI